MSIFDDIGSIFDDIQVEPSAFEIALQSIFLSGLQQRVSETGDLRSAVDATLGFKRDDTGAMVRLSDSERFDSLNPEQKMMYSRLEDQNTRLQRAFAGDLPVSERLRQRNKDQFDALQEGRSRLGGSVVGSNLDDAVGMSTADIQSIGESQRTQGLLEDTESRSEIDRGMNNIFQGAGMLQSNRDKDLVNRINAPARFDKVGFGGGLLSSASQSSRYNAEQEGALRAGMTGIISDVIGGLI